MAVHVRLHVRLVKLCFKVAEFWEQIVYQKKVPIGVFSGESMPTTDSQYASFVAAMLHVRLLFTQKGGIYWCGVLASLIYLFIWRRSCENCTSPAKLFSVERSDCDVVHLMMRASRSISVVVCSLLSCTLSFFQVPLFSQVSLFFYLFFECVSAPCVAHGG